MKTKLLLVVAIALICQLSHAQVSASVSSVKVFPNPATNAISVITDTLAKVTVYNLLGEPQLEMSIEAGQTDLKVSDLPSGCYLVQVLFGEQKYTRRIYKK